MSFWGVLVIVVGVLLLLAAAGVAAWFGWQYLERRIVLRLLARAAAVEAAATALEDTVERLRSAGKAETAAFTKDPGSPERRALHEVQGRAQLLQDELDVMPLPRSVVPLAESLADAAYLTAREAGRITDEDTGRAATQKLKSLDLDLVRAYTAQAHGRVSATCEQYGVEDTAVYGGGLYL